MWRFQNGLVCLDSKLTNTNVNVLYVIYANQFIEAPFQNFVDCFMMCFNPCLLGGPKPVLQAKGRIPHQTSWYMEKRSNSLTICGENMLKYNQHFGEVLRLCKTHREWSRCNRTEVEPVSSQTTTTGFCISFGPILIENSDSWDDYCVSNALTLFRGTKI